MPQNESSSTVGITYFDRAGVRKAAEVLARELAARHPEVEEVILFGSVAWGTPVPGTDAPYTRAEIARMRADGNLLVLDALRRGVTLFRR